MTAVDLALPRLKMAEGYRSHVYRDTQNLDTVGYGCNLSAGLTEFAAGALLLAQVHELELRLESYPWYPNLDPVRQSVLLEIAFNAGISGLLHFPAMLAAISRQDWERAAAECTVTNPELAKRYAALAKLLLTGAP